MVSGNIGQQFLKPSQPLFAKAQSSQFLPSVQDSTNVIEFGLSLFHLTAQQMDFILQFLTSLSTTWEMVR